MLIIFFMHVTKCALYIHTLPPPPPYMHTQHVQCVLHLGRDFSVFIRHGSFMC